MKSTQRTGAKRIAGITADVIFTLVLLLSLFAAVTALGFRAGGRFMGLGIVQSGSMQNSGLNKGDVVAVRPQDEYRAGDIIVFYRAPERYGEAYDPSIRAEIWIHEIIDVRTDSLGRQTYLTKGSSNAADDGFNGRCPRESSPFRRQKARPNNGRRLSPNGRHLHILFLPACTRRKRRCGSA